MLINQEIRDALSSGMPKEELRELVYKSDVETLLQDGLQKVEQGLTTFEELLKLIELDDVSEGDNEGGMDLKSAIDTARIALGEKEDQQNQAAKAHQEQMTQQTATQVVATPTVKDNSQIVNAVQ